jgi:RES domain-containing protein
VWAEWSAASRGAIDPRSERRRLWPIDVSGLPILDLRDPQVCAELGIELTELTGPRASAQSLAPRAKAHGAQGLIVPSAAREGAWNVVVFPEGFERLAVGRGRVMRPRPPAS